MTSKLSSGNRRHFISLRLRSTADSARRSGSIELLRFAKRAPSLPRSFFSQPRHFGCEFISLSFGSTASFILMRRLLPTRRWPSRTTSRQHRTDKPGRISLWWYARRAKRFRSGHPGLLGNEEGSQNPSQMLPFKCAISLRGWHLKLPPGLDSTTKAFWPQLALNSSYACVKLESYIEQNSTQSFTNIYYNINV